MHAWRALGKLREGQHKLPGIGGTLAHMFSPWKKLGTGFFDAYFSCGGMYVAWGTTCKPIRSSP